MIRRSHVFSFNDPATTAIYTLSLHDALPIYLIDSVDDAVGCRDVRNDDVRGGICARSADRSGAVDGEGASRKERVDRDRKSTRLNSSHSSISYAVFCLKKKTHVDITAPRFVA